MRLSEGPDTFEPKTALGGVEFQRELNFKMLQRLWGESVFNS
jgi:hypothetical protein